MICAIADNIVSPLGFDSATNWDSVKSGKSALRLHSGCFGLPEPFFGGLLSDELVEESFQNLSEQKYPQNREFAYTKFEKIAIISIADAIQQTDIDTSSNDVVFILSTTKGNVDLLEDSKNFEKERVFLWRSAQIITRFFGNENKPIVVSNACISGCAAQIAAERLLAQDKYRYAIVVGADILSKFVISGFQSFKSLSEQLCKPFDLNRTGLNLGEAAATIIYTKEEDSTANGSITLSASAICNDANHISAPSRTAEGQFKALQQLEAKCPKMFRKAAFVCAHGTATRYNDDMESVALSRAGLSGLPVNSLKGYFGHTLGAAGILETIISGYELTNKLLLPSAGTENPGTILTVNVVLEQTELTDNKGFIKMISGFGGINAALLLSNPKGGLE